MKKTIWAAALCLMCSGQLHAGASPEDEDLLTGKALPAAEGGQNPDTTPGRSWEFYASDKAAQLRFERDGGPVNADQARLSAGFLLSEQRDNVFTLGLSFDASPKALPGLRLSVGGRTYAALIGIENADVFGLGAGVEAHYALPAESFPLVLDASIHYGPDILTFGQADRIIDWQVNAGLNFRENITAFVGFRFFQFDTRPGDREVDDRFHIGVRWSPSDS